MKFTQIFSGDHLGVICPTNLAVGPAPRRHRFQAAQHQASNGAIRDWRRRSRTSGGSSVGFVDSTYYGSKKCSKWDEPHQWNINNDTNDGLMIVVQIKYMDFHRETRLKWDVFFFGWWWISPLRKIVAMAGIRFPRMKSAQVFSSWESHLEMGESFKYAMAVWFTRWYNHGIWW